MPVLTNLNHQLKDLARNDPQRAFIAALTAAAASASEARRFNIDREMQELLKVLNEIKAAAHHQSNGGAGVLRHQQEMQSAGHAGSSSEAAKLQQMTKTSQNLNQALADMLRSIQQSQQAIIGNLR